MERDASGSKPGATRPRIAVFSGPTATIQNSEPLVTSNKAREKHGLPLLTYPDGARARFDVLRPQRLARSVIVYVEQFTAHPLESDAAEMYAPPDGYIDPSGDFHRERQGPDDKAVFEVTLNPEDGLYPLPYMARQANGQPWEGDTAFAHAPAELSRQPFYPDASRIFEEIDRLGIGDAGVGNLLSSIADFDFYRVVPSGGYKRGKAESDRTDMGQGDIPPEVLGRDFFPYRPPHLRREPPAFMLARITNIVQAAMATGNYSGAIWLEGSPFVEETAYWLNLLIDTTLPIAGNASQRPHGAVGNDGDRNIIDSAHYIRSKIWADEAGQDRVGVVVIQDERIMTARDVQKADARPGGYITTGGFGGIVGRIGGHTPSVLTFVPNRLHTYNSQVNLSRIPASVLGTRQVGGRIATVPVPLKNDQGGLLPTAIPNVTLLKHARYQPGDAAGDPEGEVDLLARIEKSLLDAPLAGFVGEGAAPYGSMTEAVEAALERAVYSGMPVVKVGRGNADGFTPKNPGSLFLAGSNLTSTKARLLLMACLMKFGSLPPAADPGRPSQAEREATLARLAEYQSVFDTH